MIELKSVNKYYQNGAQNFHVLRDINLAIDRGEFLSIMGPSGAGKTSLINLIGFIDRQYEGEYLFNGDSYQKASDNTLARIRNRSVGFVFQNFKLIGNNTILENVELPLLYGGMTKRAAKPVVEQALIRVGLPNSSQKVPSELSGGQQQRVAIARALVHQPKFIIADEPTGALDTKTSAEIMQIFRDLNRNEGTTIVLVTHDPQVSLYGDRLIKILDGAITADEEVTQHALR
ncbi:ABC transporter ATP-binding protein [Loigolactobacillus coryniformis]|uniref:ATPase n=3 Tax=Lactobacillaceae TaxID=33958 RepID=J2Z708_9LACO|nr:MULTISPECIES: ABC transporter ATP-binding protein [Lactobacillaceae]MDT3391852.1 ABC transporter ATP-binding protein [Bacillota bacterium]OEH90641.1 peptide ABC transporter ATP-binding protein [Loigolactobacillus coryniformis subsp. coryniformis]ATO56699.1 peptide ABC transporter ATP-binding protein [Loigolactobacillus coryniformis subsp. coryniformis KCTC 3167 = DSM 20001]AXN36852.1 ABC transporter ATP-binding protein [Latilactobacillus curvatus]EJN56328.1 ATPase [Loigolactobacillus coryni